MDPSRNHRVYRSTLAKMTPPTILFMPLLQKGSFGASLSQDSLGRTLFFFRFDFHSRRKQNLRERRPRQLREDGSTRKEDTFKDFSRCSFAFSECCRTQWEPWKSVEVNLSVCWFDCFLTRTCWSSLVVLFSRTTSSSCRQKHVRNPRLHSVRVELSCGGESGRSVCLGRSSELNVIDNQRILNQLSNKLEPRQSWLHLDQRTEENQRQINLRLFYRSSFIDSIRLDRISNDHKIR